jgi:hypothetical protein
MSTAHGSCDSDFATLNKFPGVEAPGEQVFINLVIASLMPGQMLFRDNNRCVFTGSLDFEMAIQRSTSG